MQFSAISLILIFLITALTVFFHLTKFSVKTVQVAPSILTSLGVFGTFLGVALGLSGFDTANIEQSVPSLIEGLKTAFWTSIIGILGAVSIKVRFSIKHIYFEDEDEQIEHSELKQIKTLLTLMLEKDNSSAQQSFFDQTQKQLHILSNNLTQYQSEMVDSTTQALIKALQQVMLDFNTKIDEQYGQNFKALNDAVGQMRIWQDKNKDAMQDLIEHYQKSADLSKQSLQTFEDLVSHSKVFSTVADQMAGVMGELNQQSGELSNYLEQLAKVVVQARQGLPDLESRIVSLTTSLESNITTHQKQMTQLLKQTSEDIVTTSEAVQNRFYELNEKTLNGMSEHVDVLLNRNNDQIEKLDKALEKELTQAMRIMGFQLSSLSEKFVSDYTPLTARLKLLLDATDIQKSTGESNVA
ncbi:MAG: hypothetical protein HRU38_06015 [Saccharospirillaceae bacterium]|nr:hypothetical protein [Pseudomonadales bacterium]NRB78213.1 hypothetical protein [Saccharospirillaceae bacterium]